jgi:DNA-binding MarR family transcriptional regulator
MTRARIAQRARQLRATPASAAKRTPASGDAAGVQLGPLGGYIGFQLRRAQDVAFQAFRRRVGDASLSPGKFALLAIIGSNPGINQTALSRAAGRDKSTLTPALRDLVRRGWVQRERPSGDRRAYALRLSAAGREHLQVLNAHAEQHDRDLDAIVGAHYKPAFIELLDRIVHDLDRCGTAARRRTRVPEDENRC